MIFFVLSGLVIAHSTVYPNGWREYALRRAARIVSVAYPAILLCLLMLAFSRRLDIPDLYATALNSLFLGESWLVIQPMPNDSPFWSLNYEVWFYVIFGAFAFSKYRFFGAMLAVMLAGPKILLLFPAWLLGVAVYRYRPQWSATGAVTAFVLSLTAMLFLMCQSYGSELRSYAIQEIPRWYLLGPSEQFITDWLMAIVTAVNFSAVLAFEFHIPNLAERSVRSLAGSTFSIYLFHYPLFIILYTGCDLRGLTLLLVLGAAICLASCFTERKVLLVRRYLARLAARSPYFLVNS